MVEKIKHIFLLVVIASAVIFLSWQVGAQKFNQQSIAFSNFINQKKKIEHQNKKVPKEVSIDLNHTGIVETFMLQDGVLKIQNNGLSQNGPIIWQSPDTWWVDDFALADSNNDGVTDINLSVWKEGNFGSSKPFWIKENDMSIKNHFFIFDLVKGHIKAVWQSSNLSAPNCQFKIAPVAKVDKNMSGPSQNELEVIEGDYSDMPKCIGHYSAIWKWNGWGFENEWRSDRF